MRVVMKRRIALFGFIVAGTLAAGALLPHQWLKPVFNYSAYYFVLTAFVIWGALIIRITGGRVRAMLREHYAGLLLCLGIMTLVFHLSPPQFKILADETNLVGVSMAMHKDKTVSVPLQGLAIDYTDYDYTGGIDQRPPGFPFFISLIHALLGYSAYNGFILNFVAGVLVLFFLYMLLARKFSACYGVLGVLLTAACPIFTFWSTSSGFEVLNLFFVVFVFAVLYEFLKTRLVERAELLFLSLVLLAYCRYESAVFIIGLLSLAPWFATRRMIGQYRLPTLLCPLLLLPLIWQRRLYFFSGAILVGDGRQTADQLFSLANLARHFSSNLFVLSGLNPECGFVPALFILAVAGMYAVLKRLILPADRLSRVSQALTIYGLVCAVLLFLLYSAFYWGDFSTDIDNRLAMVFIPFLVVPAVYLVYRLVGVAGGFWKGTAVFLAVILIIQYRPVAEKQKLVQGKSLTYEYNSVLGFIEKNYDPDRDKLLIISDRPNFYAIHKAGSVGFDFANRRVKQLRRLKQIYYSNILVLQRPEPSSGRLPPGQSLPDEYRLRHVKDIPVGPGYCVRISEAAFP